MLSLPTKRELVALLLGFTFGMGSWTGLPIVEARSPKPRRSTKKRRLRPPRGHRRSNRAQHWLGYRLMKALRKQKRAKNQMLSPMLLSHSLGQLYAGSKGKLQRRLRRVAGFAKGRLGVHRFHRWQRRYWQSLRKPKAVQWTVAHRFWMRASRSLKQKLRKLLSTFYNTDVARLPSKAPAKAVNRWIAAQTQGLLRNLLPTGSLQNEHPFVLTSAMYFQARWMFPFGVSMTEKRGTFWLSKKKKIKLPLMNLQEDFRIWRSRWTTVVELPYKGRQIVLTVIAPRSRRFRRWERRVTWRRLRYWLRVRKRVRHLDLYMPRFKVTVRRQLDKVLTSLGLGALFQLSRKNWNMLQKQGPLGLGPFWSGVSLAIDEKGTSAAAAMGISGLENGDKTLEVRIDRPFWFVLWDRKYKHWLLMGRIVHPLRSD